MAPRTGGIRICAQTGMALRRQMLLSQACKPNTRTSQGDEMACLAAQAQWKNPADQPASSSCPSSSRSTVKSKDA